MRKATKSCYVDTNLLIFLQNKNAVYHQETILLFKKLAEEEWEICISSLVIDEYLYNTYRLLAGNRQERLQVLSTSLKKVFKIPKIQLISSSLEIKKHLKALNLMKKYNLKPRDSYHLFIMMENKVKFLATFDNDFDQVFEKGIIKNFR